MTFARPTPPQRPRVAWMLRRGLRQAARSWGAGLPRRERGRLVQWALLGLLTAGCSRPLERPQYLAYLADPTHGLTRTQQAGAVTLTCSYRPPDLLVSQELAGATPPNPAVLDSLRRTYAGKLYCTLALARDSAELEQGVIRDETALGQTISYLNQGIAQDVYLRGLGQPDSVAALAATYARQYGATGRSTVLLVFPTPHLDVQRGFTISYHATQLGLAPVRFVFPAQALRDLPPLSL